MNKDFFITLSKKNFLKNIENIIKKTGKSVAPVIKSNAYGHGIKEIIKILLELPVIERVCVAYITEAQEAKKYGWKKQIIVMSPTTELQYNNQYEYFLYSFDFLDQMIKKYKKNVVAGPPRRRSRPRFDDLMLTRGYGAWKAYSRSKLANLLFTRDLAERLKATPVTVNAVHPGVVATEFADKEDVGRLGSLLWGLGRWFMKTQAQGARTSVFVASAPELAGVSGKYFLDSAQRWPTRVAQDSGAAKKLWQASEALTGVRYPV